jgi:hypothetical protein
MVIPVLVCLVLQFIHIIIGNVNSCRWREVGYDVKAWNMELCIHKVTLNYRNSTNIIELALRDIVFELRSTESSPAGYSRISEDDMRM